MTETVQQAGVPVDNLGGKEQMKIVDWTNVRLLQEIYLALRATREALEAKAPQGAEGVGDDC